MKPINDKVNNKAIEKVSDKAIEKAITARINAHTSELTELKNGHSYNIQAYDRIRKSASYPMDFKNKQMDKLTTQRQSIESRMDVLKHEIEALKNPVHSDHTRLVDTIKQSTIQTRQTQLDQFDKKRRQRIDKITHQQEMNIQRKEENKVLEEKRRSDSESRNKRWPNRRGGSRGFGRGRGRG